MPEAMPESAASWLHPEKESGVTLGDVAFGKGGHHPPRERLTALRAREVSEEDVLVGRFRTTAAARCGGSLGVAWRQALDPRAAWRIGFQEFVRGGRALGFTGNFRKLWDALTRGADPNCAMMTLADLDKESADIVDDFRLTIREQGMTLEDFWEVVLDPDGSGRCPRDEFMVVMSRLGWSTKGSRLLFRMLDTGGQQDISFDELEQLGVPRRKEEEEDARGRDKLQEKSREACERALSDFRSFLIRNFGCLVRAWRLGLDRDGIMGGQIVFQEFCAACKAIGFRGKIRTLWKALGAERSGTICLQSLDADAVELLQDFCEAMELEYRTLDDVWERVFDSNRSGRCLLDHFVWACKEQLSFQGDARQVFNFLDMNGHRDLTIDEMEFLGMKRRKLKVNTAREVHMARRETAQREARMVLGNFRAFLVQTQGTLMRAWQQTLDLEKDGKVQFSEFCKRTRGLGFRGNLKQLWESLDPNDTGYVSLESLDPEGTSLLAVFGRYLAIFFEDLDTVWSTLLDANNNGKCKQDEFQQGCNQLGCPRIAKPLFRNLNVKNSNFLMIQDLEVLGLPRAASREASSDSRISGARSRADLDCFLKDGGSNSVVRGWRRLFCRGPPEGQLAEQFNVEQFLSRCRAIGFKGNYLALWSELRPSGMAASRRSSYNDSSTLESTASSDIQELPSASAPDPQQQFQELVASRGFVSLAHVAAEEYEELIAFRQRVGQKFGDNLEAWEGFLNYCVVPQSVGRLRPVQFHHASKMVRYAGDSNAIFNAIDLAAENTISLDDFRFLNIGDGLT